MDEGSEAIGTLSDELEKAFSRERPYRPGETIVGSCDRFPAVRYMVQGVAIEAVDGAQGQREILGVRVQGEMFGLHPLSLPAQRAYLVAKTYSVVRSASGRSAQRLMARDDQLGELLRLHAAAEWAWLREHTLQARRPSIERVAHLICDLSLRLGSAGPRPAGTFPLTQLEIGEATGLSLAQVSRALALLRERGLVLGGGTVKIADWKGLTTLAAFDPGHLPLIDPATPPAFCVVGNSAA